MMSTTQARVWIAGPDPGFEAIVRSHLPGTQWDGSGQGAAHVSHSWRDQVRRRGPFLDDAIVFPEV